MRRRALPALLLTLAAIPACGPRPLERVTLTGRAVLPADTYTVGPTVGTALSGEINGRAVPFPAVPVQGFSSVIVTDRREGDVIALQDNGFGTRANSGDVPLRWYDLRLHLDSPPRKGGRVEVLGFTALTDHDGRPLTGGDYDPESFVRLPDGSFWIGEEFGPSLLHVGDDGRLLDRPLPVPVPHALRAFSRGLGHLRSPDHPDLRDVPDSVAVARANVPRSGGVEGLALSPDGKHVYAAVEKALLDDPDPRRRLILEFDPARAAFTDRFWTYRVDSAGISVTSLEAVTADVLVVMERDEAEGEQAADKRIYRVDLRRADADGVLEKTLAVDLLHIDDPDRLTEAVEGAVGLGQHYSFPYVTPECLAVLDPSTLLVGCDNNYPFSTGRRPGVPDDSEFIRLRLPAPLDREP